MPFVSSSHRSARLPHFFIVGAPKCGTTALYSYLSTHPHLFLSPVKEPNFFCNAHLKVIERPERYLGLFRKAVPGQLCGEASALYLFFANAIPRILEWNPEAKIIALVRNPVEMAVSYHNETFQAFEEKEASFEAAWRRSSSSLHSAVGSRCRDPSLLDYRAICRLGEQITRLKSLVPESQLRIIVFDDLRSNIVGVYRATLKFLGVEDDGRVDFPAVNTRYKNRSEVLARLLITPPPPLSQVKDMVRRRFPIVTKKVGRQLLRVNRVPNHSPRLSDTLRAEMVAEFKTDIYLLGALINRDLSNWCQVRTVEQGSRGAHNFAVSQQRMRL